MLYVEISKYLLTPRVNPHNMTEAVQGNGSATTVRGSAELQESNFTSPRPRIPVRNRGFRRRAFWDGSLYTDVVPIRNNSIPLVNIGGRQLDLLDQENSNYNAPMVGCVYPGGHPNILAIMTLHAR